MKDAQMIMAVGQKMKDEKRASEFVKLGRSFEDYKKDLVSRQRSNASKNVGKVDSNKALEASIRSLMQGTSKKKTLTLPFSAVYGKRAVSTVNPQSAGILTAPGYNTQFLSGFGDAPFLNDFGVTQMNTEGFSEYRVPVVAKSVAIDQQKLEFGKGVQKNLNINPIILKPKGFQVYTPISSEILMQSYYPVIQVVRDDFALTLEQTVQNYAIDAYMNDPKVRTVTIKESELTYGAIESAIGELLDDIGSYGGDSIKFLANNKVGTLLKTTQKASGLGMILEDGYLGDHRFITSSAIKNSDDGKTAYIFAGKASDAAIGFWKGFNLTVDEGYYENGDTLVRADVYFDAALARPDHFVLIKIQLGQ